MTPRLTPPELLLEVQEHYRYLHQHPELSFQEVETAAYLERQLRQIPGITVTRPTETSVLAVLTGHKPGRTVLLRADIDALPVTEQTGLAYASQNPGVMHACGHDGHASMLLGAVRHLAGQPDALCGELRFIFQHAEELYPGGAQELVKAGVMDGVDLAFGLHLMSQIPLGTVVVRAGPLLASTAAFEIVVRGQGGHAGEPHRALSPLPIVGQLAQTLPGLVPRLVSPLTPATITVTSLHGGQGHGIIPHEARLTGSVRAYDTDLHARLLREVGEYSRQVSELYGAECDYRVIPGYATVTNDAALSEQVRNLLAQQLPELTLTDGEPIMIGEDFSAYLTRAPGLFVFVGAGHETAPPHHHPAFQINEAALEHGLNINVAVALALGSTAG